MSRIFASSLRHTISVMTQTDKPATVSERYQAVIDRKKHSAQNFGIDPVFLPDKMKGHQTYTAEHLIKKGRGAGYLDTGLGKTLIELVIAANYLKANNKRVLILTPLAVAFQFIKEAEKFGIDDVSHTKKGELKSKIILCNYERLHLLNSTDFDCVICDESSILKNFDGKIKQRVTSFLKKIRYRFLFTATPSPNDFTELGTSSEALGYLGYTDMLTKFFKNNEDTISPQNIGTEWRLKGHAVDAFFEWVSSWSISMRKPSDLGFSDEGFILPELIVNKHAVKNEKNAVVNGQILLFNADARRLTEVRTENKETVQARCEKAVDLASKHETSVYWCNINDEGDLLQSLDKDAFQIKGGMSIDKKEEMLLAFSNGEIKKLITKAKITAFGLNWQHCNHTTYFPTFSYEQYYQSIRRFWRFGQTLPVNVDLVFSDGQRRVMDSLIAKEQKANELFSKLNLSINKSYEVRRREFDKQIILPNFMQ